MSVCLILFISSSNTQAKLGQQSTSECCITLSSTLLSTIEFSSSPFPSFPTVVKMQFSTTSITALLLAALSGQTLGSPTTTPATEDTALLEKRCDCACNVACQKNCQNGFATNPFGVGVCVLGCAPNCGCSENSKC